jgi:hypothetical protein
MLTLNERTRNFFELQKIKSSFHICREVKYHNGILGINNQKIAINQFFRRQYPNGSFN